ncbi:MAG: hypothetical protein ACOC1X_03055 [Promethearchaeota archaeon]
MAREIEVYRLKGYCENNYGDIAEVGSRIVPKKLDVAIIPFRTKVFMTSGFSVDKIYDIKKIKLMEDRARLDHIDFPEKYKKLY